MNVRFAILFLSIVSFFPSISHAEVIQDLAPQIAYEDTNDCEAQSVKNGLEEGEKIVMCSDSIRYIHVLYNFAIVFPRHWNQVHVNGRKPGESGKITSIAFSPTGERPVMFHIILRTSEGHEFEDIMKEKQREIENNGYNQFGFEPDQIDIEGSKSIKYSYSSTQIAKVSGYLIFKDGFVYELTFACGDINDYQRHSHDFDSIVKTLMLGVKDPESSLLQSNKINFVF